jgi:hypothetical protein
MGIETAILGAAVIGAGTSLYGGAQQAKAQKKATSAAIAAQNKQYAETKSLMEPYTSAGTTALDTYQAALGLKGADAQKAYHDSFQTDPGWTAAQEAGLQAVDDRYRLGGTSGGNMRAALYDYGQRNMLSAYNTRLQQLGGLVDTGRSAAGTLAGASSSLGSSNASLLAGIGSNAGSSTVNAGNAVSGALTNLAGLNLYNQGMASGQAGTMANGGWSTRTVNYAGL